MAEITNSDRVLLKATYTPITLPQSNPRVGNLGRAGEKAMFANSLQLAPGEVRQTLDHMMRNSANDATEPLSVLQAFEQATDRVAPKPEPARLAGVPVSAIQAFGAAVIALRTAQRQSVSTVNTNPDGVVPSIKSATVSPPSGLVDLRVIIAHNALTTFNNSVQISPIGMLHLERIEMAPAGIERGELIATIPLAPQETTNVVHKEWATTSEEFSSIVTDSLENYSEKGVTEKSELADATNSETKHSSQISLGATVSGSYGTVSFSTNASLGVNDSNDQSQQVSRKQASEITSKAAARVRKERKVTIETQATVGKEDTSVRTITNPSSTDSMRIDYYSMMRKWRVRLLQYGIRMTYDIAVPEPGATLRESHAFLAYLDAKTSTPFSFPLLVSDINESSYLNLASQYGVSVAPPPQPIVNQRIGGAVQGLGKLGDDEGWHFFELSVDVPDGYRISAIWLDAMIGNVDNDPVARNFIVFGYGQPPGLGTNGKAAFIENLSSAGGFLINRTGHQKIVYFLQNVDAAAVTFSIDFAPLDASMDQWRFGVWQALHDAARDAYYTSIQALASQRDALRKRIEGPDTLTLRQEERIEVMKGALRWLLGPDFDFMPDSVTALFPPPVQSGGLAFTGNKLGLDSSGWMAMFRYQEMVKFLQQAIEWENLLYFLYPYFWDVPPAWDFVRTLEHPDSERQKFLRAGSARIVLTIRPGFEQAFTAFVDQGAFGAILPPGHPYLTIGQEVQAYDKTNYPGIPPANADSDFRPLLSTLQRKSWLDMQAIISALEDYKTANGSYPSTVQGLAALANPSLAAADPWGNAWIYKCPGVFTDYELSSLGADNKSGGEGLDADITSWAPSSLIAEWFEYTPSKGVDIQLNTAPALMA
ncbi:MAG: type II secretion system protein GspG [Nitrospira sp.]